MDRPGAVQSIDRSPHRPQQQQQSQSPILLNEKRSFGRAIPGTGCALLALRCRCFFDGYRQQRIFFRALIGQRDREEALLRAAWAATNAQIKPCVAWIESIEGPDPIVVGACRGASRQIPRQEEGKEQKKRSLRWIDRRGRINCGNAIRERRSRTLNRSLGSVCFGGSARLFCSLGVRAGVPNQVGPTSAQIRHGQRPSATVGAATALPTVHVVDTGRVLLIEAVALGCSGPCVPLVRRRHLRPGLFTAPRRGVKKT